MLALVALLSISVATAAAEFKSTNKSTEGSANFAFSIEGAGTTVYCGSAETNQLAWQIKKEGKAAESGRELALKFKSWGTCALEYKEGEKPKEATLSGGECTWEASEPGSEREVPDKIVSSCVLKGEIAKQACEVTISPKANEKLGNLTLIDSGKSNENLAVNIGLSGVTVGASGAGCEIAGIKSTSVAKLTGTIEALAVTPGVAAPVFGVFFGTSNSMTTLGEKRTVSVVNIGSLGSPGLRLGEAGDVALFKIDNATLATCQGTILNTNASCLMTVEFKAKPTPARVSRLLVQITEGGVVTAEVSIFGSA